MEGDAYMPFDDDEDDWAGVRIVGEVRRRIVLSIATLTGGAVWVLLYLGFLAVHFAWYTNVAVVLTTLVVVPAVLLGLWVHWGVGVAQRMAHRFSGPG